MLARPMAYRLPTACGFARTTALRWAVRPAHSLSLCLGFSRGAHSASSAYSAPRPSSHVAWTAGGIGVGIVAYFTLQAKAFGEEEKSAPNSLIPPNPPSEEDIAKLMEEDDEPTAPKTTVGRVGVFLYDHLIMPILVFKRFLVLALLFGPVILAVPLLFLGRAKTTRTASGQVIRGERWGALVWYDLLVAQMGRAGPTFVKLGQWAGSRHDLFPDELCERFAKLHSNNSPHAFKHTKRVLEHAFQKPFDEIFESFDRTPVGVGAVGQVYKARVRHNLLPPSYLEAKHHRESQLPDAAQRIGEELALMYEHDEERRPTAAVAIKVLHPHVRRTIGLDIRIMRFFANTLNALPGMKWVSLPEEVHQFATLMFSQLDLRHEAYNLARFERNFARRNSAISFPRPLLDFCSKDVLVEEMIDAVPLKYFLRLGGLDYDARIADLGLDAFLNMLLIDNFTHADLHPGNIMVSFYRPTTRTILQNLLSRILAHFDPDYRLSAQYKTGIIPDKMVVQELLSKTDDERAWHDELQQMEEEGYLPELVFLDAGLISELSPKNLRNFLDLFASIANFDGRLAGRLMVERCRSPELVTDKVGFERTMEHIVSSVKNNTFNLANLQIGDVLSEALKAVREYHVKMEPDFVDTVLSILILEGIGRRLDPDLDLFRSAIPILRKLGHRMSGDESQLAMLRENASWKTVFPMIKLWFYVETRSMLMGLTNSPERVDAFIRYGWLSE